MLPRRRFVRAALDSPRSRRYAAYRPYGSGTLPAACVEEGEKAMSISSEYTYNQRFLSRDGQPWLPVMGEFHYARYPQAEWAKELAKMKACGVDIVATYVFWIHHEAVEGCFDFTGCRDLRGFLQACRQAGLPVWLRIGPWSHGECRNGGFPDWLLHKGIPTRCNHPVYLALTQRFWEAVYAQAKGMFHHEGGPIIGVQIENEFGHCGGSGESSHMERLLEMAKAIGFQTPYYTATGWGGAVIGPMLPVMACYCDAPWDARLAPLPPSPNYIFSHERNDADVGSDFARGAHVSFDEDAYPYLLAEMGGGIGATFHRRPTAVPADTAAMSLVKLGSGANLLGYYMYHGGVNPGGELNETRESGSYCETPAMSYMPHAPIGDGGQVTELAKDLKLLAMFLRSYGAALAPLPAWLPPEGAARPEDTVRPRYALRAQQGAGFAFVNNHQRGLSLPDRRLEIPGLGSVSMPSGGYGIFPMRLPVGRGTVSSTSASPLCVLPGGRHVFYGEPRYNVEGDLAGCQLITLTRREALDAWPVQTDGIETLVICQAPVLRLDQGYVCLTRKNAAWRTLEGESGMLSVPDTPSRVRCTRVSVNYLCQDYALEMETSDAAEEVYLQITYAGAMAELFVDGQKVADHLYDGEPWEIALNRYGRPQKAALRLYALFEGMPCWLQHPPAFQDGRALQLMRIAMENEYLLPMTWR